MVYIFNVITIESKNCCGLEAHKLDDDLYLEVGDIDRNIDDTMTMHNIRLSKEDAICLANFIIDQFK